MNMTSSIPSLTFALICIVTVPAVVVAEDWPQLLGNAQHSGDASHASLQPSLGIVAAIPCTDAILASPVVSDGKVFVVDGSGVVFAIDTQTLKVVWKFSTRGGSGNCNNVAAPAVVGKFVHVGTMAGYYYVLDRDTGAVVKEIDCREPIFSVAGGRRPNIESILRHSEHACMRLSPTVKLPGRGTL